MEKLGDCRVPLNRTGMHILKVVKTGKRNEDRPELSSFATLQVVLTYETSTVIANRHELSTLFSPEQPQFQHLYLNFRDNSPSSVIGLTSIAGPTIGEQVLDRHTDAVWSVTTHTNAFGDSNVCSISGMLVLTELRLLFIPHSIAASSIGVFAKNPLLNIDGGSSDAFSEGDVNTLRRLTVQIPLPTIDEISCVPIDGLDGATSSNLNVSLKDGSEFSFKIQKSNYVSRNKSIPYMHKMPVTSLSGDVTDPKSKRNTTYISGLETDELSPWTFCTRVVDSVNWMLREDLVWVRWLKAIRQTVGRELPFIDNAEWAKENEKYDSWETDFIRLRVQDANWIMSDVNTSYEICPTYPQTLVVPVS